MLILIGAAMLPLLGMLALIPLGLRIGDRACDARIVEIEGSSDPRGASVTLTNPDRVPVLLGMSVRPLGLRLRVEGASYVRIRTRSTAAELRARAHATVAVLGAGETGTFFVGAASLASERAELVVVIGHRERLRTIHRIVLLPLQSPLRRLARAACADTVARCRPSSGSALNMERLFGSLRGRCLLAAFLVGIGLLASAQLSSGDLSSRERTLKQNLSADNGQIQAFRGRLSDLQARLSGIESSLAIQRSLLARLQRELADARTQLGVLRAQLARDRRILAAQLVSQYESPTPDLMSVVFHAHGFGDLLEHVDQLKLIARRNTDVIVDVARAKRQVQAQTVRLAQAQARQRRVTAAVLVEREQVESLRLTVLRRERVVARDRARQQAALSHVEHQLAVLRARAAAAQRASFAASDAAVSPAALASGGLYGFFPAAGTNYSVGEEPEIAARLDRLGKALHLHMIGLSGYRSPQHSVEVGGFADDPHTHGLASDTPGVEGVPEATLLQFGLTRPFPGPAEADHIQLA